MYCCAIPRTLLVLIQGGGAGIDVNFPLKLHGTTRQDSTRRDKILLCGFDTPEFTLASQRQLTSETDKGIFFALKENERSACLLT
jgi:hypothetical protein